jgi:acetolactate synthase I/II/III large subunit
LTEARRWLAEAKKPVMIAGLDVMNHHAEAELRRFVETYQIPLVTTYKAKGVLPEDHPLALGGAGLSPLADKILLPLFKEADLILAVGYDPIEMRVGWRDVWDPTQQRVVEFAAEPNLHYMHHSSISFVCDVGEGLKALSLDVKPNTTWANTRGAEARAAHKKAFASGGAWGPAAIVEQVRKALPRNAVATVDSGAHRILMSQLWEAYEPRGVLQSSGLCTMGCALPLAMGVAVADPSTPVVAFSGDAGLLMVLGELSTLAELKLPVIIVVFVDASLTLIEMKQRSRQLPNAAVDFGQFDFGAIGRAFGGVGVTITNANELDTALAIATQQTDNFTLIGAVIDRRSYDGKI